jgi:hypothetical protein
LPLRIVGEARPALQIVMNQSHFARGTSPTMSMQYDGSPHGVPGSGSLSQNAAQRRNAGRSTCASVIQLPNPQRESR